jgi:hypothetical protein
LGDGEIGEESDKHSFDFINCVVRIRTKIYKYRHGQIRTGDEKEPKFGH